MTQEQPLEILDFRQTKCPLNFVKTRLALEKIPMHAFLEVWISNESDSVMNIPKSIQAEGHAVIRQEALASDPDAVLLWIRRLK